MVIVVACCDISSALATITEARPTRPFWAGKIVFWARNASRRGLFGQIKLYFGLEMRPAGAFWADKIALWPRNASRRGLLGG